MHTSQPWQQLGLVPCPAYATSPTALTTPVPFVAASLAGLPPSPPCREDQAFNIVDIKPQNMEDLTEVGGLLHGVGLPWTWVCQAGSRAGTDRT